MGQKKTTPGIYYLCSKGTDYRFTQEICCLLHRYVHICKDVRSDKLKEFNFNDIIGHKGTLLYICIYIFQFWQILTLKKRVFGFEKKGICSPAEDLMALM